VLIVVHNNPRGVEETLTSAAAAIHRLSTQDGFEAPSGGIVVVDDGSTDETRHKLIQWMQAADVPLKLYCTAWQVGVSRARNLGLEAISTEWVCILDSDNTLLEGGLIELLEHSGDGAGCFGSMWVCNRMKTMHELAGNQPFDFELLLREGPQMDSTALFRTEVLKGFGGYDEDLLLDIWGLEDFDLWLRLGEAGVSISHVSQPIGTLRRGADAHWSQFTRQTLGDAQRVFEGRFGSKFTAYKHESVP
jgi:glycosyltransferase involved in cell wall biosynthesis